MSDLVLRGGWGKLFRVRLAKALHDADCGCEDFGDPTTDEDDRYIKAVDATLALFAVVARRQAPDPAQGPDTAAPTKES